MLAFRDIPPAFIIVRFQMSGHKKARPKGPVVQNPNSFRMERPPDGPPVELENQFILRLPQVLSKNSS